MITTLEQAKRIQTERSKSGKRGVAKAVRRFVRRQYPDDYRSTLNEFPVNWASKD